MRFVPAPMQSRSPQIGGHVLATGRDGVAGWDITKASSDEVLSFPTIAINGDVAFTPDGEWIVAADAESGRIAWRSHKGRAAHSDRRA